MFERHKFHAAVERIAPMQYACPPFLCSDAKNILLTLFSSANTHLWIAPNKFYAAVVLRRNSFSIARAYIPDLLITESHLLSLWSNAFVTTHHQPRPFPIAGKSPMAFHCKNSFIETKSCCQEIKVKLPYTPKFTFAVFSSFECHCFSLFIILHCFLL